MVVKQVSVDIGQGNPNPKRRQYESESQNSPAAYENLWTNQGHHSFFEQSPFEEYETANAEQPPNSNVEENSSALELINPFSPIVNTIEAVELFTNDGSRGDGGEKHLNAFAPGLSAEERKRLVDFDPRWWIEHLDTNRGRSVQLAYLDKTALSGGLDKLLMSAVVASWVQYFPRDYNLLAQDALEVWSAPDLEAIEALTVKHFARVMVADYRERYATGEVKKLLGGIARKMRLEVVGTKETSPKRFPSPRTHYGFY